MTIYSLILLFYFTVLLLLFELLYGYIMRYVNVHNVRLRNTMCAREYERKMRGHPSFSVDEHEYFTDMSEAFS